MMKERAPVSPDKEEAVGVSTYSIAWKNCATCAFWGGPRQATADGEGATVNSSAAGRCDGFWKGSLKYGNDKCREWQRWGELKAWESKPRDIYP